VSKAYYNEIDPDAAEQLRNLIAAGDIAPGDVDTRSIEDVRPDELKGYTQCHFFAGIGGWSHALRLAGWPDERPVWTGSCPCQPFSTAGKGKGLADERHLWPAFEWLIGERRPDTVFGEQVSSPDGRAWLDIVSTDMEGKGYAFGAIAAVACSVGAPMLRQRTYWVADTAGGGRREERQDCRRRGEGDSAQRVAPGSSCGGNAPWLADPDSSRCESRGKASAPLGYGCGAEPDADTGGHGQPGPTNGFWRAADWLKGRDERWRPVQPGTFVLVDGLPAGLVKVLLKGFGNAIVPQQAAEFIESWMDRA